MLSNTELEQASTRLTELRQSTVQHQETLSEVLTSHALLVEQYRRLKSDHEEEREAREKWKQLALGLEKNSQKPFALVLVDADDCMFGDDFTSAKGSAGGETAAGLLEDAVREDLRSQGLDKYQIVVRIYGDLLSISKSMHFRGLIGSDKRSLAPFFAGFNQTNPLFDFVDASETAGSVQAKVSAALRQHLDNPNCQHVYFAGCHRAGYSPDLTRLLGNRSRATLVRTSPFLPEYNRLGLRVKDLTIFGTISSARAPRPVKRTESPPAKRSEASLSSAAQTSQSKRSELSLSSAAQTSQSKRSEASPSSAAPDSQPFERKKCAFYIKTGTCKFGESCHFTHDPSNLSYSLSKTARKLREMNDWRTARAASPASPKLSETSNSDPWSHSEKHTTPAYSPEDSIAGLPRLEWIPEDHVAINSSGHRLDCWRDAVPAPVLDEFHTRFATPDTKLCNSLHLIGFCSRGDRCDYSHRSIDLPMRNCLRSKAHGKPCPRRGGCRDVRCTWGHICQNRECRWRGGGDFCKFDERTHDEDLSLFEFTKGVNAVPKGPTGVKPHSISEAEGGEEGDMPEEEESNGLSASSAHDLSQDQFGNNGVQRVQEEEALLSFDESD